MRLAILLIAILPVALHAQAIGNGGVPGGPGSGGSPTGAAGGSLSGTYPNPGIASGIFLPLNSPGLTCDGSTDNSTKLQAAITAQAAAGGGIVQLPASTSTCNFASTLTRPRSVLIQGQNRIATILNYTGSGVAFALGDTGASNPPSYKGGFAHITLQAATYSSASTGIYMGGDPAAVITPTANKDDNESWTDFQVSNFGIGVRVGNNAFLLSCLDCNFLNNGQHFKDPGTETNSGERMSFLNSTFVQSQSTTAPAIELDNNLSNYFFSHDSFDYNGISQPDFGCLSGQMHVTVSNSNMEKTSGEFFHANNSVCIPEIHIFGGSMLLAGSGTNADMISIAGTGTYQNVLSVIGTSINADGPLTQFVDANGGERQITLDSLDWGYTGDTNLGLGVNTHGNSAGITIRNTQGLASIIGDNTSIGLSTLYEAGNASIGAPSANSWALEVHTPGDTADANSGVISTSHGAYDIMSSGVNYAYSEYIGSAVNWYAGLIGNGNYEISAGSGAVATIASGAPAGSLSISTTGAVGLLTGRKGTFVCTGAGTISISNTYELATSDVVISLNTAGGTISTSPAMKTVTAGTGFTVLCGAADTSTYNYDILN